MPIGDALAQPRIGDGEFKELLEALAPSIPYRWHGQQLSFEQDVQFRGNVKTASGLLPQWFEIDYVYTR